jgi:hypothetical protein
VLQDPVLGRSIRHAYDLKILPPYAQTLGR